MSFFNLNFCTDKYKKEFKKNRRWLKINFHGKNGNTNLTNLNLSEFKNLFCDFKFQINRICGLNLTKLTRLHNYNITYEQLLFLRSQKINKLFASEKIDIDCYNLKKHEKRLIKQKGVYLKDKMKYINVHIRLDNCQDVLKEIKKIDEHKIYILDIELANKVSGISIAKLIREVDWESEIVFVTNHDKMFESTHRSIYEVFDFIEKFHDFDKRLKRDIKEILKRNFDNKMFKYNANNVELNVYYRAILYNS